MPHGNKDYGAHSELPVRMPTLLNAVNESFEYEPDGSMGQDFQLFKNAEHNVLSSFGHGASQNKEDNIDPCGPESSYVNGDSLIVRLGLHVYLAKRIWLLLIFNTRPFRDRGAIGLALAPGFRAFNV